MSHETIATLRAAINQAYLADENKIIGELLAGLGAYNPVLVTDSPKTLVNAVRTKKDQQSSIDAFLREYQLNSQEGIVLMGIAEALLRIPDSATQDQFLQEKLIHADWQNHKQHSDSFLVNLSSQALLFTSKFEDHVLLSERHWFPVFEQLLSRIGAPLIRTALKQVILYLAEQLFSRARYNKRFNVIKDSLISGNINDLRGNRTALILRDKLAINALEASTVPEFPTIVNCTKNVTTQALFIWATACL